MRLPQTNKPVYENGKLIGWNCSTWNREGTRCITIFVPLGSN